MQFLFYFSCVESERKKERRRSPSPPARDDRRRSGGPGGGQQPGELNSIQHFLTILTLDLIFTSNRFTYFFTLGGLTREQHLKLKTQQKQYVDAKEKLEAQLLKLKEQRESLKEEGAVHEDKIMKENHKLQVIKLFLVPTSFFSV